MKVLFVDVIVKASGVLLLPIYLRLMLPEEYGLYTYAIGFASVLASLGGIGMYGALNRYYYDNKYLVHQVMSNIVAVLCLSMILFLSIAFFTKDMWQDHFFSNKPGDVILIFAILSAIHLVFVQFLSGYYYIKKEYKKIQWMNLSRVCLVNMICLSLLYFSDESSSLVRLIGLFVGELIVIIYFLKDVLVDVKVSSVNSLFMKELILFGLPISLNGLLGFFYAFADKFFIQHKLGFANVATFSFIMTLASFFSIGFSVIQNFWLPYFFNPDNRGQIKTKTQIMAMFVLVLNMLYIAVIYVLFDILFFYDVFDSSYGIGRGYLWCLCLAQGFLSVTSLLNNFFSLLNKTIYGVYISVVMASVSIFLNYIFIGHYGEWGAAFATVLSALLLCLLTYGIVNRLENSFLSKTMA